MSRLCGTKGELKVDLLNLFAIKEPTVDRVSIEHGCAKKLDTVLYRDRECTKPAVRWPWHYSNCPRTGQKTVMFNCYQWNLVWLDSPKGREEALCL